MHTVIPLEGGEGFREDLIDKICKNENLHRQNILYGTINSLIFFAALILIIIDVYLCSVVHKSAIAFRRIWTVDMKKLQRFFCVKIFSQLIFGIPMLFIMISHILDIRNHPKFLFVQTGANCKTHEISSEAAADFEKLSDDWKTFSLIFWIMKFLQYSRCAFDPAALILGKILTSNRLMRTPFNQTEKSRTSVSTTDRL